MSKKGAEVASVLVTVRKDGNELHVDIATNGRKRLVLDDAIADLLGAALNNSLSSTLKNIKPKTEVNQNVH